MTKPDEIRTAFHAMGSKISVVVDAPPSGDSGGSAAVRAMLGEVRGWFLGWERCLSRFRPDSELSQLNRQAGQPVQVSTTLWEVLQAALEAARQTGGMVTPTILPAVEAAGYDRSFEQIANATGQHVGEEDIHLMGEVDHRIIGCRSGENAWREIEMDTSTRSVRLPIGLRLDLGGFAKGWAADQAAQRIAQVAPVVVDAGGDIAVSGPRTTGQPWQIGVGHPNDPAQHLAVLPIIQGGVATSGRNYHHWVKNGAFQHHLIDPRTGRPAETDVWAATVIAPSALEAEIAAKAVVIAGSEAGVKWLAAFPRLSAIIVLSERCFLSPITIIDTRSRAQTDTARPE